MTNNSDLQLEALTQHRIANMGILSNLYSEDLMARFVDCLGKDIIFAQGIIDGVRYEMKRLSMIEMDRWISANKNEICARVCPDGMADYRGYPWASILILQAVIHNMENN